GACISRVGTHPARKNSSNECCQYTGDPEAVGRFDLPIQPVETAPRESIGNDYWGLKENSRGLFCQWFHRPNYHPRRLNPRCFISYIRGMGWRPARFSVFRKFFLGVSALVGRV